MPDLGNLWDDDFEQVVEIARWRRQEHGYRQSNQQARTDLLREISRAYGWRRLENGATIRIADRPGSLDDRPAGYQDDGNQWNAATHAAVAEPEPGYDAAEARVYLTEILERLSAVFSARDLTVIAEYAEGDAMADIGLRHGISESRVSQIIKRIQAHAAGWSHVA